MYILDTLFGAIKTFETKPSCTSFPWLNFLNQIVKYLDNNYKLICDRLWPRRRGTGAGPDVTVSDEELDTGGDKKGKKAAAASSKSSSGDKEADRKKTSTKVKVKMSASTRMKVDSAQ